ncbi:MAG: hypothetical protein ACI4NU_02690 [Christensenellales bacterium]
MKKTRAISLLLSLSLICAMLVPGAAAFAENESGSDNGMVINKTATANPDGSYTITLEAYATGSKVISEVKKDIPTDIVLVLDQSGSMKDTFSTTTEDAWVSYGKRTNSDNYADRAQSYNGNLWYKLPDGSYVEVSVTTEYQLKYTYEAYNSTNGKNYYQSQQGNLYCFYNGEYEKVTVTRTGNGGNRTYTYVFPDGNTPSRSGTDTNPGFTDEYQLYVKRATSNILTYTYSYTLNGVTTTIGSASEGADTVFDTEFYEKVSAGSSISRLSALKTTLTNFAAAVNQKAAGTDGILGTDDDVNHRIAVVGYASRADFNNPWINTEVFIGADQYNYNEDAKSYYGSAFQSMNTTQGQTNVAASIGALDANGATYTNYGLEMANGILDVNPVQDGETRNRVIILFSDGYPGRNADDFNQTAAEAALKEATTAKNAGVSLYAVGIFSGADATSPGNKNGSNTEAANWFMQNLSSNNGTPQTPSYYLSAADASTLNNIFQQISDNIDNDVTSATLSKETVIKDIIAPAFTLPQGAAAANITLETYQCTGKNGDAYTWSKNADAMGATATVNGDQVSVTGFDFAANYVGPVTENGAVTGYRGHKLVISFTVSPKAGFLGGNNVYTNTSAGVYADKNATEPVLTFERPQVNVPIQDVAVTAADKNVYLLSGLTADELKSGATVTVGGVPLNLTAENYGLETWQTEYVDITVKLYDADGTTEITDLTNLTDDTTYTISVTVTPKTDGTGAEGTPATAKSGTNAPAAINVFKPVLTFKDSNAYYGEAVPANNDYSSNKVGSEVWKHGDITSTDDGVTMLGTKPSLEITYTPDSSKIVDGKYTKQDVPVKATVKIGTDDVSAYTTFIHQDCADETWTGTNGDPAFMLHVKTCQLTITKTGGTDGEPYVFNIYKDYKDGNTSVYTQVTIVPNGDNRSVTIYELPVGAYTIEEDTGWSWRFTASYSDDVTLSKDNASGTITCTNSKVKDLWLNGFSAVVKNIFGTANN